MALQWSNQKIAGAIGIDQGTLKRHYGRQLEARAAARDRVDGLLMAKLLDLFLTTDNVAAARELRCRFERNDQLGSPAPAARPSGKKQRALELAQQLDPNSTMDRILIARQARQQADGEPPN